MTRGRCPTRSRCSATSTTRKVGCSSFIVASRRTATCTRRSAGKLEIADGEGPHDCALREIREEASIALNPDEIKLISIVSERAYQGEEHWLIFLFEATRPIRPDEIPHQEFDEGRLEWHRVEDVEKLPIPETDRAVMWPNVCKHRGGFFMVHIDCAEQPMRPRIVESWL
jgi:8-oxo-dGTP diphosphatase